MDTDRATVDVESDVFEGELARAIRLGDVEVNPHMTPEQERAFAAHVAFYDRVVARGMATVEAEKRDLVAKGLMTDDGILAAEATRRVEPASKEEGYWLMEMERKSLSNRT